MPFSHPQQMFTWTFLKHVVKNVATKLRRI